MLALQAHRLPKYRCDRNIFSSLGLGLRERTCTFGRFVPCVLDRRRIVVCVLLREITNKHCVLPRQTQQEREYGEGIHRRPSASWSICPFCFDSIILAPPHCTSRVSAFHRQASPYAMDQVAAYISTCVIVCRVRGARST